MAKSCGPLDATPPRRPRPVGNLVGEDPAASPALDRCQPIGIPAGSFFPGVLSRFSTTWWETRHLAGAFALGTDGLLCPPGGVMKNNVKIAVTLGAALVLFYLVKHFFPLGGAVH